VTRRRLQINMQPKWRRVFAIAFGVLICAAIFALLEGCVLMFVIWWRWVRLGDDTAAVFALVCCVAAFPFIAFIAARIGLFAYEKLMPPDRIRQDG
jgi:hypothetical protein